ncbi:MAG: hypothetical protein WC641_03015 [Patescibacteria group bacterium]
MKQDLSRFRGMDKAQIKLALEDENRVVTRHFGSYEEFVEVAKNIPPWKLLECAKQLEITCRLATYCHRRYVELTGDREKYYGYLVRRMFLEQLRRDFPERMTKSQLSRFGRRVLNCMHGSGDVSTAYAYKLFREAEDEEGMLFARKLAVERGHIGMINEYHVELDSAECQRIWRAAMAKGTSSSDQVLEFLSANGMRLSHEEFVETVGKREGFLGYKVICDRLRVRPSTKFLVELLKATISPREKLPICSLLKSRNPKRWAGKERSIAAALRDEWLCHGEPVKAKQMAALCGKPLTVDELLRIHQRFCMDNEIMRSHADQALDMAAALIARRTRRRRNKAKVAA